MATTEEIRKQLRTLESRARREIAKLKKRAPKTDAARRQAVKAVRKLRTELNRNLTKLEKAIAPPKKKRKTAKAKRA